ncbi:flagellar hook-length control protein [Anaerolinea thermolimosa]|uniref:flagellar hook-length control protein FliK n=1 Tax=Anaerolinea thermolimosa TaxID=229919 RepID=UPI0007822F62|nr:flagellar hook-length control protein FliK [Anaerolinea thermolimosa]GAP07866.1 flagellar hook-length control protein [Anaerolinea thermolimosa]
MVEVFCIPARASPASASPLSSARSANRSEETGEGGSFEEVLKAKEKEQAEAEAVSIPGIVQPPFLPQDSPPGEMPPVVVDPSGDAGIAVGQRVVFPATAPMVAVDDLPARDSSIMGSGGLESETPPDGGVSPLPDQPVDAAPLEGEAAGEAEPVATEKPAVQVADQFSRAIEMLDADGGQPSGGLAGMASGTGEAGKGTVEGAGPVVKASTQAVTPSRSVKPEERLREEAPTIDGATMAQVPGKPVTEGHSARFESSPVQPSLVESVHQVARAVEASIQSGKNFIRLQLHPHELGGLDVRLVSTAQGVSVTVFADQASTGRLLEMQIDQLRQTLADAGVQLAHLDVHAQAQPGQQQNFAQTPRRFFYARGESMRDAEISGVIPAVSPSAGLGHRVDYQV